MQSPFALSSLHRFALSRPRNRIRVAVSINLFCVALGGCPSFGLISSAHAALPLTAGKPLSEVRQMAAGRRHACAVSQSGAVWCWGNSGSGFSMTPQPVAGLAGDFKQIAAAEGTCAVNAGGEVYCWAGTGYTFAGTSPAAVDLPAPAASVAVGSEHACALTTAKTVYCWGSNSVGQLGNRGMTASTVPVPVPVLTDTPQTIVAGATHTCLLGEAGTIACWGGNFQGQIGDGSQENRSQPTVLPQSVFVRFGAISASGYRTCAITNAGAVWCWGAESNTLGGWSTVKPPGVMTGFESGGRSVIAGWNHTCVIGDMGLVRCVGANDSGQLGDGSLVARTLPAPVSGLAPTVTGLTSGFAFSCAWNTDGNASCWGQNDWGQLGIVEGPFLSIAADVQGLVDRTRKVVAGGWHSCALGERGGVTCWGSGLSGQLGNTTFSSSLQPVQVAGMESGVVSLAAGAAHTCAVDADGTVWCWGDNRAGQLGDGTSTSRAAPIRVLGIEGPVAAVSASLDDTRNGVPVGPSSCALTRAGQVWCWGSRSSTRLPTRVTNLPAVVEIAQSAGLCARTAAGALYCWDAGPPALVGGLEVGVRAMAVGSSHTCAVRQDERLVCWGRNNWGQLGDGTTLQRTTPQPVVATRVSRVAQVAASLDTTCAIDATGATYCWGEGFYGKRDDDTLGVFQALTPIRARALGPTVSVALGFAHGCAVSDGGVKCWGRNIEGQLGLSASGVSRPLPAPVTTLEELVSPAELDFGVQLAGGLIAPRSFVVTNTSPAPIVVNTTVPEGAFRLDSGCRATRLQPHASCTAVIRFAPTAALSYTEFADVVATTPNGSEALRVALFGTGSLDLIAHYYQSLLGRVADEAGQNYWQSEDARMQQLAVDRREVYRTLAVNFITAREYVQRSRDNAAFIEDLYLTFYARPSDSTGSVYWLDQLQRGVPRDGLVTAFYQASEFERFMANAFGAPLAMRPEVRTVVDFYRAAGARLPDTDGLSYWVGEYRTAQCASSDVRSLRVRAAADRISTAFFTSAEYNARNRDNAAYLADLYSAFVQRAADADGVTFWTQRLAAGTASREDVRAAFRDSLEFQTRIDALIAAGCQP